MIKFFFLLGLESSFSLFFCCLPPGIKILNNDGLIILGSPIGTPTFESKTIAQKVGEIRAQLHLINILPSAQNKYVIARSTLNRILTRIGAFSSITYWANTTYISQSEKVVNQKLET
jgi:hypothetical protein